jgi:hypothetical protein
MFEYDINKTPREVTHMNINDILSETPILLPTRASSSGAAVNKTEYIVVDGLTPYIYVFSFCGMYKGAVPTLRPYRKIAYCMETDSYYALGCNCNSNIYILNCRFEETGRISTENNCKITDISLNCQNGCETLILSHPHSVSAYTKSGIETREIRKFNNDVFYNSFAKTDVLTVEGITKGCDDFIRIIINCEEICLKIPNCVTLKNLFTTDGGGIYGFFSKDYINNYIIPIYENETVNSSFFMMRKF